MPRAKLYIDKIHDKAETQTISDISGDTGKQKRERSQDAIVRTRRAPEKIENEYCRDQRDHRQSPTTGIALVIEHRKRSTGVLRIGKIQEARNDRYVVAKTKAAHSPRLRRLVDQEHAAGDGHVGKLPKNIALIHRSFSLPPASSVRHRRSL